MEVVSQLFKYLVAISLMVVMLGMALVIAPFSAHIGWRIYRCWSGLALRIFGVEVESKFEYDESQLDNGGVIVGLTQQSVIDPTAGYATWSRRVMSVWNFEYALIPFFGWVTVIVGWIIIRQKPEQAKRQLRKAAQHAAQGGLVYLSAEGQRSSDGELNAYKKGPIVLAIESQLPIHPIYIAGSRECLPVGEWKIRPGRIIVHWLAPISTKGLSYEDRNELLAKVRKLGEKEHDYWSQASTREA
ncbi:MAG: lysophospholipid acyltransferase family protein [Pseudomonadales bacterium]